MQHAYTSAPPRHRFCRPTRASVQATVERSRLANPVIRANLYAAGFALLGALGGTTGAAFAAVTGSAPVKSGGVALLVAVGSSLIGAAGFAVLGAVGVVVLGELVGERPSGAGKRRSRLARVVGLFTEALGGALWGAVCGVLVGLAAGIFAGPIGLLIGGARGLAVAGALGGAGLGVVLEVLRMVQAGHQSAWSVRAANVRER